MKYRNNKEYKLSCCKLYCSLMGSFWQFYSKLRCNKFGANFSMLSEIRWGSGLLLWWVHGESCIFKIHTPSEFMWEFARLNWNAYLRELRCGGMEGFLHNLVHIKAAVVLLLLSCSFFTACPFICTTDITGCMCLFTRHIS